MYIKIRGGKTLYNEEIYKLILNGISKENTEFFRDNNGLMVLELNDVYTGIETEFFSQFKMSNLSYLLLQYLVRHH